MDTRVIASDPKMAQLVRNLNIMVQRVEAVGKRWGFNPCRAMFVVQTDQQVLDDLNYPVGIPVCFPAWWFGKAAYQQRSQGMNGHVFEFATISDPAHVVEDVSVVVEIS